jgi:hypothetical protein
LIVFMMAILSEAFVVGLETFRQLKAIGDMNERLGAATTQLKIDLQADHFESKRRLGDPSFWAAGSPREGFFQVYAPTTPFSEGADGDGIPSAVATDMVLHMSVKQRANRQEKFFTANIVAGSRLLPPPPPSTDTRPLLPSTVDPSLSPADGRYESPNQDATQIPYGGGSYSSPWAEVAYYLLPNGEFAGSTPLFTLYRAQYVVTPDNSQLNWPANNPPFPVSATSTFPTGYSEMSCELNPPLPATPTQIYFNSPTDLAGGLFTTPPVAPRRVLDYSQPPIPSVDPNPNLPPNSRRGSTFVLGDVISFEIQVLLTQPPALTPAPNASFGYVSFDTATIDPRANPSPPVVSAVQITLRVWDKKTLQTRQITIIQDM